MSVDKKVQTVRDTLYDRTIYLMENGPKTFQQVATGHTNRPGVCTQLCTTVALANGNHLWQPQGKGEDALDDAVRSINIAWPLCEDPAYPVGGYAEYWDEVKRWQTPDRWLLVEWVAWCANPNRQAIVDAIKATLEDAKNGTIGHTNHGICYNANAHYMRSIAPKVFEECLRRHQIFHTLAGIKVVNVVDPYTLVTVAARYWEKATGGRHVINTDPIPLRGAFDQSKWEGEQLALRIEFMQFIIDKMNPDILELDEVRYAQ